LLVARSNDEQQGSMEVLLLPKFVCENLQTHEDVEKAVISRVETGTDGSCSKSVVYGNNVVVYWTYPTKGVWLVRGSGSELISYQLIRVISNQGCLLFPIITIFLVFV
jgi:hypothetical protein